jgi:pimeloyl-ACP methyl ester carboxylesterase
MVSVGGHRLHACARGTGAPTVVFDSVVGASSLGWALVQPEVARLTHTLAYDRAGYGWSEAGPRPRSAGEIVTELHALLTRSGTPGPYVLVGASFGGSLARLYALRYPDEVAGLVLVDPAHEDQFARMSASTRPPLLMLRLFQVAAHLGILRLAGMPVDVAGMRVLPPDLQMAATAVGYRTDAVEAIVAETAALDQSLSQIRQARIAAGPVPLGSRPLLVLTHKESAALEGAEAADYATWVALHQSLASESSCGRQVVVEKSGHFIAVDQPARVVEAIREVVTAVRNAGTPAGRRPAV